MSGYKRVSINMVEDNRRYGIDNKKVFGSCVLEEKDNENKIIVKIENLKKEFAYNIYAIFVKKGQYIGVDVGKIESKNNRHQFRRVIKNGVLEDEFKVTDILAIIVGVKVETAIETVLEGFVNKTIRYKENFSIHKNANSLVENDAKKAKDLTKSEKVKQEEIKQEEIKQEEVKQEEIKQEEVKQEEVKQEVIKQEEVKQEVIKQEEVKQEEIKQEVKQEEVKQKRTLSEIILEQEEKSKEMDKRENFLKELTEENENENKLETIASKFKEEYDEIMEIKTGEQSESKTSVLRVDDKDPKENLKYLFKYGNKIEPFKNQKREVKWITIKLEDLSAIYNNCWQKRNNIVLLEGYKKYKHLMLGKYDEDGEEQYILGIPNKYDEEDKEVVIKIGGVQYREVDSEEMKNVCPGYWLILVSN